MKSITKLLLILIFNLIEILSSKFQVAEAILGGSYTYPNVHGYQVSIQANDKHIGVGALISDLHALSAANLFIGTNELFIDKVYKVVGGVANLNADYKIISKVAKISIPRIYRRTHDNQNDIQVNSMDIAVLKFTERFHFTQMARMAVVTLPPNYTRQRKFVNQKGTVTGFGVEDYRSNDSTGPIADVCQDRCINLKSIDSTIMRSRSCESMIYANVDENNFCAKAVHGSLTTNGLCYGDVGAPFIINRTIIGILIKHRDDCSENYYPSIYTAITKFGYFIDKAMSDADLPGFIRFAERKVTPTEGIIELRTFI